MIPIKKLKAKVVAAFNTKVPALLEEIETRKLDKVHYLSVPILLDDGGMFTARYNVRRSRFDRLLFRAFGKDHRIKL